MPLSSLSITTTSTTTSTIVNCSALLLVISLIIHHTSSFSIATNSCPSNQNNMVSAFRTIKRILPAPSPHWVGDGFKVFPVFSDLAFTEELSPMLMFDYGAPNKFPPRTGQPLGVGQHPHRGFETITIAFQGEVEHHDSVGNSGVIGTGDVQWMTAGRGIIHQEYHSKEFTKNGGTFEMCQLWLNLPKKHKMTPPKYQSILKDQIPSVRLPLHLTTDGETPEEETLGTARVIAGELGGVKGPASTFSPVQMWDINLPHAGSEIEIPYPPHHTCIVFVRRGSVEVLSGADGTKASKLGPQDVALMKDDGSELLKVRVLEPDTSILVMGGEPLNEPIAAQGPFVMNDYSEIRQAFVDFRSGRMGE